MTSLSQLLPLVCLLLCHLKGLQVGRHNLHLDIVNRVLLIFNFFGSYKSSRSYNVKIRDKFVQRARNFHQHSNLSLKLSQLQHSCLIRQTELKKYFVLLLHLELLLELEYLHLIHLCSLLRPLEVTLSLLQLLADLSTILSSLNQLQVSIKVT